MHPTTREMLQIMADLAQDDALDGIDIRRRDAEAGSPFDSAIFAWVDAGCPDAYAALHELPNPKRGVL